MANEAWQGRRVPAKLNNGKLTLAMADGQGRAAVNNEWCVLSLAEVTGLLYFVGLELG